MTDVHNQPSKNSNLRSAKKGKNDEFYTQLVDIENELRHYKDHFRGKTIYCNCDDPSVSNFFKYFALNFDHLGLKKLITSCYRNEDVDKRTDGVSDTAVWLEYEGGFNSFDEIIANTVMHNFVGDGDFRSDESIQLLQEADIVVTNPPFSLFREYVAQLVEYDKKFVVIGSINAVTYKDTFDLILSGDILPGYQFNKAFEFEIPDSYPLSGSKSRIDSVGKRYVGVSGIAWYTNMDISKRHDDLIMHRTYSLAEYPTYDNYDAINVDKVKDIPYDYSGVMGVPITFLDKYNPEQFEILGLTTGRPHYVDDANPSFRYVNPILHSKSGITSNGSKVNTRAVLKYDVVPSQTYFTADNTTGYLVRVYARILIRNRKAVGSKP